MPDTLSDLIDRAGTLSESREAEALSHKRVRIGGALASAGKRRRTTGTGECSLAHLFRLLDSFGMKRTSVQRQLHLGMAGARGVWTDTDASPQVASWSASSATTATQK